MTVKKSINVEKSNQELIKYVNTIDFFKDFLSIIDPLEYEIITDSDIESNSVTWPVKIIYKDIPEMPVISLLIPEMIIEQEWNIKDNIIKVNIKAKVLNNYIFEMEFICTLSYIFGIDIEGKWINKSIFIPDMVLECLLNQFEDILEKICN
jgi:hypothetical protein